MYLIGFDIGSSSIKASIVDASDGVKIISDFYPKEEMKIDVPQKGWAEQNPEDWWRYLVYLTRQLIQDSKIDLNQIKGIGLSYQMHGLVLLDEFQNVLRPAIIWCDSRAVTLGDYGLGKIGKDSCFSEYLNSPGNFTASKLAWVKQNEPEIYSKINKILLPGDYIAMKLTGLSKTTIQGLSEGIFWNFKEDKIGQTVLDALDIKEAENFIPELTNTFGIQGTLTESAAKELGIPVGVPVAYRAGDQPNNALSLNVLNPGEIAATAGTSGVVFGILDSNNYDLKSRVNIFAHVNYSKENHRLGALLCINGCGILNAWVKKNFFSDSDSYDELNKKALEVNIGADGLVILPFGNGAERMFENQILNASFFDLDFNRHTKYHVYRAAQEAVVFSFAYGMEIMKEMGIKISQIKASHSNMFLSPLFRQALSSLMDVEIQIYDTDGSVGAALGAGIGVGIFDDSSNISPFLNLITTVYPVKSDKDDYDQAYLKWKSKLKLLN